MIEMFKYTCILYYLKESVARKYTRNSTLEKAKILKRPLKMANNKIFLKKALVLALNFK